MDRLERLAALQDRGLITDEEFAQQKRRTLGES
ncbi:MAG TPA: SHOCT domain-containing protein [Mycobacterium sp.]|nr:SHOCT domain-containing protein [Mycobacterium sp.]